MSQFLEPTDANAFVDHPMKPQVEGCVECPKCKGHGGWNLRLNAYSLHGKEDTPENRHLFAHFRASCNNCWGWGYVEPKNADHVHDWKPRSIGNCESEWTCATCNEKRIVDSSD